MEQREILDQDSITKDINDQFSDDIYLEQKNRKKEIQSNPRLIGDVLSKETEFEQEWLTLKFKDSLIEGEY